ncbi:MAG: carboxypeptidase-like regulatory domain-containing protein [Thermoproteota archaeon]|nr:carboxypeptidase-like regulatory domain-containing protein [Thermoproteota archaeon]
MSNREGVIEVTGEYDTGSWAASHEHRKRENVRSKTLPPYTVSSSSSQSALVAETKEPMKTSSSIHESAKQRRKSKYLVAAYTTSGIIGAIALAGFIISGGVLPNSNSGSPSSATAGSLIGSEPGVIHGYVEGISGLPAIGASVIAENLKTGESISAFASLTGGYLINLPPGTYQITVSFPNGATQVVDSFEMTRGTAHELNFSYND